MKYLQTILMGAALCSYCSTAAFASDIKVIANASVTASAVSAEELKGVFLATKTALSLLGGAG